jgi:hypothetical protein
MFDLPPMRPGKQNEGKEPTCAFNLRKFPRELRKELRLFAVKEEQDVQDIVSLWLRERLDEEKQKRKNDAKAK